MAENWQSMFQNVKYEMGELIGGLAEMNKKMAGMMDVMKQLKEGMAQKDEENIRLTEQNAKLGEEKRALKRKIGRIETYFPNTKKLLISRSLPVELVNELFASLPLGNAFFILAKMPNYILAKNVRKMLEHQKMAMKMNKWNEVQCPPNVTISGNGLVLTNSTYTTYSRPIIVLGTLPVPKFNLMAKKAYISFYFEVQLLKMNNIIDVGFCTQSMNFYNSIWIWRKERI